jgi:hypothetical protein
VEDEDDDKGLELRRGGGAEIEANYHGVEDNSGFEDGEGHKFFLERRAR